MAPRLGAVAISTPQPLRESLVVLVDRTAREAGIGKSLVGGKRRSEGQSAHGACRSGRGSLRLAGESQISLQGKT